MPGLYYVRRPGPGPVRWPAVRHFGPLDNDLLMMAQPIAVLFPASVNVKVVVAGPAWSTFTVRSRFFHEKIAPSYVTTEVSNVPPWGGADASVAAPFCHRS